MNCTQSQAIRILIFILFSLFFLGHIHAQQGELNTKNDIRGRPFQASILVLGVEGAASVPWECETVLNAIINNSFSGTPGVGAVLSDEEAHRLSYAARSLRLQSRHFMVETYVEGGGIFYNRSGGESLRFLSFQVSIINIATSRVERTFHIYSDSQRYAEKAKELKATKFPKMNVLEWAVHEHAFELVKKEVAKFFFNIIPIEELVLDGKEKGFYANWYGTRNKDLHQVVDVVAVRDSIQTPTGLIYQFAYIGTAKYFNEKSEYHKPYYRFISGEGRAAKAKKLGMKIYFYPDKVSL